MIYIYDIILNFNSVFYEFYEWDSKDNLTFIRKIPLVKVDTNFINDILTKKVVIDDPIVLEITNKCEITSCKKANNIYTVRTIQPPIDFLHFCCVATSKT